MSFRLLRGRKSFSGKSSRETAFDFLRQHDLVQVQRVLLSSNRAPLSCPNRSEPLEEVTSSVQTDVETGPDSDTNDAKSGNRDTLSNGYFLIPKRKPDEEDPATELAHPPEIRKARVEDAGAIAEIHVASWQATYPGLLPQDVLDTLSVERRADMWRGILQRAEPRTQTRVVEVNGEMAGFVNAPESSPSPSMESWCPLSKPPIPANGNWAGLVSRGATGPVQRRFSSAGVVLEGNPACRFYEKMGGSGWKP